MQREREAWLKENKEAISAKIDRGLAQLDRGEGISDDELRGRLAADRAAYLKDRSHR
jgi:predicted transcriptional regulator